tara:strand:- start:1239 stop:2534 length:1296 start_codon:yes stop_codon:yes gene_type:complete
MWRKADPAAATTGAGPAGRTEFHPVKRAVLWTMLMIWSVAVPACAASPCPAPQPPDGLQTFYKALSDLKSGARQRPVTVLHLGDSHIALDHLTGELRSRGAAVFGDGGRGLVPGVPYAYYAPQGYQIRMSGNWRVASSLTGKEPGPFGISGYRIETADADAEISLVSDHDIGTVEIEAYGGPETGAILLTLGTAAPLKLQTRLEKPGPVFLRVPAGGAREVRLRVAGGGPVRLLGWTMEGVKSGFRYDSYGISGATLEVVDHWDEAIVEAEIRRLAPDLILLGYGTNEGFNDHADAGAYGRRFSQLVKRLQHLAPEASIGVLGALDGARRAKPTDRLLCSNGWATPPKLGVLRDVQRGIARQSGIFFEDMSRVMGGTCGIARWVDAEPPLAWPDHVHLRPEGARLAGAMLWQDLMGVFESTALSCIRNPKG